MKNVLIIGLGEIGDSIKTLEIDAGNGVSLQDLNEVTNLREDKLYDVCHVCIPYSDKFVDIIADYLNEKIEYVLSDFENIRGRLVNNFRQRFASQFDPKKLVVHI